MPGVAVPPGVPVTYRQQYRRCGKAACSRCAAGGPGHGPYWYAFWSESGRSRSRYLGTQAPAGVSGTTAVRAAPVPPVQMTPLAPLRVRTLGGFAVWRGETALGFEQWSSQRAAALFKCLLSAPGHRLPREQAIDLLWPEAAPEAGAANLRTTMHLLRRVLDAPGAPRSYLRTEGGVLALAPQGAASPDDEWLDATAFARAARSALARQDAAACRAALTRYTGEYLPDSPYDSWAMQPREALRQQHIDLLLHLAALCGTQGDPEEAEGCLREVLAAEPSHEEAAATLMGLLAASGRRGEALRLYQTLAAALEQELDVAPSAELEALRAQILAREAAPPAVQAPVRGVQPARPTNLPLPLTSFVGRAGELAQVCDALEQARVVTLTGPGGCGKTRLALEVAGRLVEAYADGVWLAELAALADPALAPRAVMAALGVVAPPGRHPLDTLVGFLRPRQALLVLDNCEHLIGACAHLVVTLLQACPRLRVLATSREALAVAGEHVYLVPSLAVPDPTALPPLEQLGAYEAVQLFLERARARQPEVTLTAANAAGVARICARLDGLPLAIELAAARVSVLPIAGIAARLDDRFRLLTGGPRTALPRQQTLRATLDWSYALLSAPEQVLLRRLAVFVDGCTLEAAEAICADDPTEVGGIATAEMLDLLSGLVQKSLVLVHELGSDSWYRLLETVRQYGQERLEAAGELALLRDRHLGWYVALGEQAGLHVEGPQQLGWLDRLEREHHNLRAALQWSTEQPARATAGVRLAGAIWRLWALRGYSLQGRHWLEQTLARAAAAPAALRARALYGAAELAYLQGDYARARAYGEEGLALYREVGDTAGIARTLVIMAWAQTDLTHARALGEQGLALARAAAAPAVIADALRFLGNLSIGHCELARAQAYLDEGLALGRDLGDKVALADILIDVGQVAFFRGAYERAAALFDECLSLQHELRYAPGIAMALHLSGGVAYCRGDTARAIAMLEQSIQLCRDLGYREHLAQALETRGRIACRQGDQALAATLLKEGVSVARELGDTEDMANTLAGLGHVARERGHHARAVTLHRESLAIRQRPGAASVYSTAGLEGLGMALGAWGEATLAARLLGAAAAAREGLDTPLPPPDRAAYERTLADARAALGGGAFAAAWATGQAMTLEQAIDQALAQPVPDAAGFQSDRAVGVTGTGWKPASLGERHQMAAVSPHKP